MEWQPIETCPDGTMLLFANMMEQEARWWSFVGWRHNGLVAKNYVQMPDNTARKATHWMHLPPAPIISQSQNECLPNDALNKEKVVE